MAPREPQASSGFMLSLGGLLLVLVAFALFVCLVPIAPDPRPRKPMDGVSYRTTYWDKWTFEWHVRCLIREEQAANERQKADAERLGTVHRDP